MSSSWESVKVKGAHLVETVKHLVHEGNVRRIVIKQDAHTIAEFPLTAGVVGVALAPLVAAVGALAAILTECTIEVERAEESGEADKGEGTPPAASA